MAGFGASTAVMKHMRLRTLTGPAPLHIPPLVLLGPPGIAKSTWARDLGRVFNVPSVDIDVGASNGTTFSVSGVERGWGSATPGRVADHAARESGEPAGDPGRDQQNPRTDDDQWRRQTARRF